VKEALIVLGIVLWFALSWWITGMWMADDTNEEAS
jgi:hypothetical protein